MRCTSLLVSVCCPPWPGWQRAENLRRNITRPSRSEAYIGTSWISSGFSSTRSFTSLIAPHEIEHPASTNVCAHLGGADGLAAVDLGSGADRSPAIQYSGAPGNCL